MVTILCFILIKPISLIWCVELEKKKVEEEDSKNVLLPCVVLQMTVYYVRCAGAGAGSKRCYFCGRQCRSVSQEICLETALAIRVSLVRTAERAARQPGPCGATLQRREASRAGPELKIIHPYPSTAMPGGSATLCSAGPVTPYQHVGAVQCSE